MTDAIVGVLAQQLYNTIKAQTDGCFAVKSQLDQIAKDLDFMKSFVIDATKLNKQKDTQTVNQSLVTMRELIYDADDILLDYQVRTDCWSHAPIMHCTSFHPQQLIFYYQTENRLNDINMNINHMKENLKSFGATINTMSEKSITEESRHNKRRTSTIYKQPHIVGLIEDTAIIKQWILQPNEELQHVGIVGMGGLGKTTLTEKIFNDKDVKKHFQKRIWVSVSQIYTVTRIMKNMLEELKEDWNSCTSKERLLEKIEQALLDNSYLIVMDDVWDTKDDWWKDISTALPNKKGCIIITTRNDQVATSMGAVEARIRRPRKLDKDESWLLFCNSTFKSPREECKISDQLKTVGKEIVDKCVGLPLAIKTIGGLLSTKQKSLNEWKTIRNDFHAKLQGNGQDGSVLTSLQLSYNELPPELKHCILCFSIFPEDYIISTEQLVLWWVGEGFVSGKYNKTAIQVAYDYLSELFSRCLIEVVNHRGYDGRISDCKMHDLVRDLIIRKAKEEAFCNFDDRHAQQFNSESRHLGLTSEIKTQSLQSNSKLRALLLTKDCPLSFSLTTGLAKVNSLRVLDLSQSKLDGDFHIDDLLHWIRSQRRLAYLNLRGVAGLKQLPKWIRKLRNLRILILADCNDLEGLSPYVKTLPKLTVLDIRNCPFLQNLPQGLGNLIDLEELSGFKLASRGKVGCRLMDLKCLSKLRVLRINIREVDDIGDDELEVLSHLKNLQTLSIDTNNSKSEEMMNKVDRLILPECLQELYLRNYAREFTPGWLTPSKLPNLHYLCIEHAELTSLKPRSSDDEQQRWNIQGLCLKYLTRLMLEWKTLQTNMPELEYVEVSRCKDLQNFPWKAANFGVWRKKEDNEEIKEEITS